MSTLLFVTKNQGKLLEVQSMFNELPYKLLSLNDVSYQNSIPEDYFTLEENSLQKARTVYMQMGMDCFADDSGLEVFSLNGQPGVRSARYAGENATDQENYEKLVHALENIKDRSAQFRTVITLIRKDEIHQFEGVCKGEIILKPQGKEGFGYDPVFIPEGFDKTFSECTLSEKNSVSHRRKAMDKLKNYLLSLTNS